MKKPLLVLFDGNALIHRAFHALPPLSVRKTGEIVGAVFGFAQILLKVLNDLKPTHYAVAFDRSAPTFRHIMYDQYKATRKETPEDLRAQFKRVRELVKALNMPAYELDGFEADDVLGALSKQASEQGIDSVIVTGDADAMQLVTDRVKVFYPRPRGTFSEADLFDADAVVAKYGIKPEHIADYKALKGDPSDNILGVPGIGEKTAVKLIQQFGGIDQIYARLDEVQPPRLQALLREQEPAARQSKTLATIDKSTPVTLDLQAAESGQFDRAAIVELLRELDFHSLIQKLPESATAGAPETPPPPHPQAVAKRSYRIVSTPQALDELVQALRTAGAFAVEMETDGPNAMRAAPVGIAVSMSPGEAYYIPVGHTSLSTIPQLQLREVADRLRPLLADPAVPKTAHNGKFDIIVLTEHGFDFANLAFDTEIAAYLLCEGALDLKSLVLSRLGIEITPITDLIGKGARQTPMSQVETERAADFGCAHADMALQLSATLGEELRADDRLRRLFDEIEMPLVPVLVHMERSGVLIDGAMLTAMSRELGEQLLNLEREVYLSAGHQFNINSPQQLSTVLFEEQHLPGSRKRGGGYTTSADKLEVLRGVHPIINQILEYRQVSKLKSTYIDALPGLINPKTGRLHTSFNQTRTTTGRLSSSDPNLQNIPIRGEQGKLVRSAFIAPPGSWLLAADYSQIDLRSLAHLSQDENLLGAFRRDEDIHSATAAQLFGVPPDTVTGDMRRLAKTVNFGVIYGMSEFGLEQATELTREEAGKFITAYFDKYPGVKAYLDATREHARTHGHVATLLGRKRIIPEIRSPNRMLREGAERMAINMPVQGTSADIIKKAMVDIYAAMTRRGLKSKMLLQVHDELVFEVPEAELDEMRRLVRDLMENAIKLDVPLKAECKVARNWGGMDK